MAVTVADSSANLAEVLCYTNPDTEINRLNSEPYYHFTVAINIGIFLANVAAPCSCEFSDAALPHYLEGFFDPALVIAKEWLLNRRVF